ncbi:MAG: glycosyltransferase, partial [Bacteroidota bacterium]
HQMNAGAEAASGEILLFLHADTHLPPEALALVRAALAKPGIAGGCFMTHFIGEGAGSAWMRLWEAPIWMRWWRFAFGDRALFCTRETFEAIGGYRSQPLFEDLDLVRDLRARGRIAFLDAAVETSARRFGKHGALWQQLRNLALWAGWNAGVSPERLARHYPTHRPTEATPSASP